MPSTLLNRMRVYVSVACDLATQIKLERQNWVNLMFDALKTLRIQIFSYGPVFVNPSARVLQIFINDVAYFVMIRLWLLFACILLHIKS